MSDWKVVTNRALGLPETGDTSLTLPSAVAPAAKDGWQERFENARLDALFRLTGSSLSHRLKTGLESFRNSLESFEWPKDNPVFGGRLVTPDKARAEHVAADVRAQGQAQRYYKFFSSGVDAEAPVGLESGDYRFAARLGGDSEAYSLTVEDDWTEGDLLNGVAEALNAGSLQVQAEVVRQDAPKTAVPDLNATGTSLLIAVNGASPEQALALADTRGGLLRHVDLSAVNVPTDPASLHEYTLFSGSPGKPTAFVSTTFDPGAATNISEGSHTVNWAMGESSGSFSFSVNEDDTWKDVLGKVADAAGAAQNRFSAGVRTYDMPSELVAGETIEGAGLYFEALSPKLGDRLSLTAGDSGGAMEALGLRTAQPGRDSELHVDGDRFTRAVGPVDLDYGRVSVEVGQGFSEALPMAVVDSMEQMQHSLSDIVTSFNAVYSVMRDNAELLREDVGETWREPYERHDADARFAGLQEGTDGLLWLSHDDFYTALGADAERVQSTLLDDEDGLLPEWMRLTTDALDAGADSLLINPDSITDPIYGKPSPRTELELEQDNQLLDVVESDERSLDEFIGWGGGALVDRKG